MLRGRNGRSACSMPQALRHPQTTAHRGERWPNPLRLDRRASTSVRPQSGSLQSTTTHAAAPGPAGGIQWLKCTSGRIDQGRLGHRLGNKRRSFQLPGRLSREYPLITTNGTPRARKTFATSTALPSRRSDVEQSSIRRLLSNQAHRAVSSINRTNDGKPEVRKGVRKTFCCQKVVFDDQNSFTIANQAPDLQP